MVGIIYVLGFIFKIGFDLWAISKVRSKSNKNRLDRIYISGFILKICWDVWAILREVVTWNVS